MSLLLPVGERRMSSWTAHQHRNPRSSEPGTDFYCPIGTPVVAPEDGRVYGWGDSIIPATGRWVGLDLNNGMRFRAMHFSRIALSRTVLVNKGFVRKGQVIGYSGASGYGDEDWSWNPNTGGAHTHVTLWPTQQSRYGYAANGKPYTVDFMNYVGGSSAGGGSGEWDDDMSKQDVKDAVFEVLTGAGLGPGGRNHFDSLKFIAELSAAGVADNVWKQPIIALDENGNPKLDAKGNPIRFQAWGFLSSIAAQVQANGPEVDAVALAEALAPLITANLSAMSDADVQKIAKAAADEQSRRLAG